MAIDHNAFPQPEDQGFDFTRHDLGESRAMRPHDLTAWMQMDPEGSTTVDPEKQAFLSLLRSLVGAYPIHTGAKALLEKYCREAGSRLPERSDRFSARAEESVLLRHGRDARSFGQIISYLEKTPDPRRPGHFLISNTYVVFTFEIITDN